MKQQYQLGDKVKSSPESGDDIIGMTWHATIVQIMPNVRNAPDGVCYVTIGTWDKERKKPTRRQLWANHMVLDV